MRAVVQVAGHASVSVAAKEVGRIGPGLVILLGITRSDTREEARSLADKIMHLRIFPDDRGQLNLSVQDIRGEVLVVSQFTLYGDCRKGRRPSYSRAAPPDTAKPLYELFCQEIGRAGIPVATGEFQALMQVALVNHGPVTLLLDTDKAL